MLPPNTGNNSYPMPRRSLEGTIEHLTRVHGKAAVPAHLLLAIEDKSSASERRLINTLRRQLVVPPQTKQARMLREEGLTVSAIARTMGVSERTIRNWLRRPRQRFRLKNVGGFAYARVLNRAKPLKERRLFPVVSLRLECLGSSSSQGRHQTFAAARCEEGIVLQGRTSRGYCRSCKRRRIFKVLEQRPLPFLIAQLWRRSRKVEYLEF